MKPYAITGPIVPGWIRETVRRHEETWPVLVLAAAVAAAVAAGLLAGVMLWTSDAPVYYALP
jgi:hypothetical protein